ncbi:MAG: TolC family protein [Chitinophagaceae bacterium]
MQLVRPFIYGIILSMYALSGCAPKPQHSRAYVSDVLKKNYGFDLTTSETPGLHAMPPTVIFDDGISEDEAVSIALYNNAPYQADLVMISIAQADLVDAGVISNPLLRYLLPSGGLNVSGYINVAFDFLWQRPRRIAIANTEIERTAENMVQRGYTVIRDVQTGFANLQLARDRTEILAENARIRRDIARLNNTRFRLGEISELEASTSRADSAAAMDEFFRATLDTILTKNRLNTLLGFSPDTPTRFQSLPSNFRTQQLSWSQYLDLAYTNQPELRAAQLAIRAAGNRMGWERSRIVMFMATLGFDHINAKGGTNTLPNAVQPGIQAELPVLNRNQGRIARARSEMEQASFQYVALRQRIATDVADAYNRYEQTLKSYEAWNTGVLSSLQEAVRLVQLSFQRGDISYLPVLEAMRQLVNGRLRKAEIEAELKRSVSQLNFAIGRKTER